ncbi:hypothetical protein ABLO02_11405, partial [Mycobacterium tuberculosis]
NSRFVPVIVGVAPSLFLGIEAFSFIVTFAFFVPAALKRRTKRELLVRNDCGAAYRIDLVSIYWRRPIRESYDAHAQDRRPVTWLPTYDDHAQTKPLNEMPVDFAKEIVRLWRVFIKDLNNHTNLQFRPIGATAQTALASEINAAKRVRTNDVTQRQIAVGKETSRLEPNFSIPQIEWPA